MSSDLITMWQEVVRKSFLRTEEKERLVGMLQTTGATSEFTDAFDTMLANATDAISEKCDATLQKFANVADALGAEYKSKEKLLRDKLKQDLAEAPEGDKRDAIMNAYYTESEKLMEWHETGLKKTSEEILRSLI